MKSTLLTLFFLSPLYLLYGQCATDLLSGQNLVTNGDFTSGYSSWTFTPDSDGNIGTGPDGYIIFNPPVTQSWSQPGFIYAGTNPNFFNSAFSNFSDHSASADNTMLMVDGVCSLGIKLWSQSGIPIKPNTNYYFSVWIHSLKDNNNPPGTLRFDINGVDMGTTITAPTDLATGWILFEQVWFSGATPPPTITISIENTTTTGCDQYVDFAIDDISFIPGCTYGAAGPQPDLGPDKTICGTGGSIVLNTNVAPASDLTVTWSDGTTGSGLGAPYTKTINSAGTYSVCVTKAGSCTKSDVVVISNTYSINLGPDLTLCNPASATLDAGYTGPGVTFQWYKNPPALAPGTNNTKTYFVNTPGTYRVVVTDPACGSRQDDVVITSNAAVPNNGTYCTNGSTVTVSVSGSGSYKWYDTPAKGTGTQLATGTSYTTPALSAPSNYTYYVEDVSSTSGMTGLTTYNTSGLTDWGVNTGGLQQKITITQDAQITSIDIPVRTWGSTTTGTVTIEVRDASGNSFSPAKTFTSTATSIANNGGTNHLQTFSFTGFNIQQAWGSNLRLAISAANGFNPLWNQGGGPYAYPYASSPTGIIDVTGSGGSNATNNDYVHFYRINFQTGVPCQRVPVTVTYSCPAPLDFISFEGEKTLSGIKLFWSTANEHGTGSFNILKSLNGIDFVAIGNIKAVGTGSNNYEFLDVEMSNKVYYKIAETDLDGKLFYTNHILIESSTESQIYPNPAERTFTIKLDQEKTVKIFDSLGRMVMEKIFVNEQISLPPGFYIIQIQNQFGIETKEVVVQ